MAELQGRHVGVRRDQAAIMVRFNEVDFLDGLWVKVSMRGMDLKTMQAIVRGHASEDEDEQAEAIEAFGPFILAWNEARVQLDGDGEPVLDADGNEVIEDVPATLDGWRSLSFVDQRGIIQRWSQAITGRFQPDPKSPTQLSNGAPSPEQPETTEALSLSHSY